MTAADDAADKCESLRRIVQEAVETAKSVRDCYSETETSAIDQAIELADRVVREGLGSGLACKELDASAAHAFDACVDARGSHSQSAALAARYTARAAGELLFAQACKRAGISRDHSAIRTFASLAHQEAQRIHREKTG